MVRGNDMMARDIVNYGGLRKLGFRTLTRTDGKTCQLRGRVQSLFNMDTMESSIRYLACRRALIGVIHVGALPGTPSNRKTVAEIADEAVREARVYEAAGFHGLAIENTHDRPYLKSSVGPEIGAAMAVLGSECDGEFHSPWEFRFLQGQICGLSPSHTRAARALFEWRGLFSPT